MNKKANICFKVCSVFLPVLLLQASNKVSITLKVSVQKQNKFGSNMSTRTRCHILLHMGWLESRTDSVALSWLEGSVVNHFYIVCRPSFFNNFAFFILRISASKCSKLNLGSSSETYSPATPKVVLHIIVGWTRWWDLPMGNINPISRYGG